MCISFQVFIIKFHASSDIYGSYARGKESFLRRMCLCIGIPWFQAYFKFKLAVAKCFRIGDDIKYFCKSGDTRKLKLW